VHRGKGRCSDATCSSRRRWNQRRLDCGDKSDGDGSGYDATILFHYANTRGWEKTKIRRDGEKMSEEWTLVHFYFLMQLIQIQEMEES